MVGCRLCEQMSDALAVINGVGPRVGESGFRLIARFPHLAPRGDHVERGSAKAVTFAHCCPTLLARLENRFGWMEEAMAKSELTRRELLALSALGVIAGAPGFAHAAGPQG